MTGIAGMSGFRVWQEPDEKGSVHDRDVDAVIKSHPLWDSVQNECVSCETETREESVCSPETHHYTMMVMHEPNQVCFRGFKHSATRELSFCLASCLTLGLPCLAVKWWPALKCQWRMTRCSLADADLVLAENAFDQLELAPLSVILSHDGHKLKTFVYRHVSFFSKHGSDRLFSAADVNPFASADMQKLLSGEDHALLRRNRLLFGENVIELERKTYWRLFVDEIAHPFNVFQLASVLIWCYESYYLYALTILLISAISIAMTLHETRKNNEDLRAISRFRCLVKVLIDSELVEMDSSQLVPGHVIALDASMAVCPCDVILVRGDAIVDESMLTGESVPVSKTAIHHHFDINEAVSADMAQHNSASVVYCGTRILRARETLTTPALGLVHRTGFQTAKGQLLQAILHPKPISFNFYSDSMKYIAIFSVIAACGFVLSLYNQLRLGATAYYIISRALDLITVVIPPALPATMSIGTVFSLGRLKKKAIHCISPSKINVASRIDVCCFDKTGTLTEEGMDLFGVVAVDGSEMQLLKKTTAAASLPDSTLNLCMALCHSLQRVDGLLVGDPLDVKMFESSSWILEESHNTVLRAIVRPSGSAAFALHSTTDFDVARAVSCDEVGIIRCFEFCSARRRMSVLTKRLSAQDTVAFCKGSPESILQICRPNTVPTNFHDALLEYARNGLRVIACAYKPIEGLSWIRAQRLGRDEVETELCFLGFLVFENKIKKQSPRVVSQLSRAKITSVMVTGDNLLTAVCVSRSCGIVSPTERVFMPAGDSDAAKLIDCTSADTIALQDVVLQPDATVFACTGAHLQWLLSTAPPQLLEAFIRRCRVFARMSPEDKKTLVELFQSFHLSVGFCGDGANDCGALKAADIGISLSDSEASVAAPFSSSCKDISCVISVLLEGRAALATSFSCFKFMALYSMIQFTSLVLLYCFGSSLGDYQFVYIDLAMILPLGMLMSRFEPADHLVAQQPDTRLISPPVLLSLLTQIVYQAVAQAFIYCHVLFAPSHGPPVFQPGRPNIQSAENTAVFLFSNFLYLATAVLFCTWRPFRSFYPPFYLYVLLALLCNAFFLFGPHSRIGSLLELASLSLATKGVLVSVAVVYFVLSIVTEYSKPHIVSLWMSLWRTSFRKPVP